MLDKLVLDEFLRIIDGSKHIVFFGGAGVSTESGIPDFRSTDGLYNQKYKYPPEEILSHFFFLSETEEFYRFYKDKMLYLNAKPNNTHIALAKLEQEGKLSAVVTQNIDGLHQRAGSKNVYELHGSVHRNHCIKCNKAYGVDYIVNSEGLVPRCTCGGLIKPDVVLYDEGLEDNVVEGAINSIYNADTLIIGGTSMTVQPAAGMVRYFRGSHLIVVNMTDTYMDSNADLVIREKLGEVFGSLLTR